MDNPITEKLLSAVQTIESFASGELNVTEPTGTAEQYTTSLGSTNVGVGQLEAIHKVVIGLAHETPVGVSVISTLSPTDNPETILLKSPTDGLPGVEKAIPFFKYVAI